MSYDPKTIQSAIKKALVDNNTTTSSYDLSANLAKDRVGDDSIKTGHPPNQPMGLLQYPWVTVYTLRDEEKYAELGNSPRRAITVDFVIAAFANAYPLQTLNSMAGDAAAASDDEAMTLARNIKTILRNEPRLSNTVYWCDIVGTDYDAQQGGENNSVYVSSAKITVRCILHST